MQNDMSGNSRHDGGKMDTKKYIIEIPDNTAWLQWVKVSDKDGHVCFDFKDPEDLTLYTEPDVERNMEEAFKNGYDAACKDIDVKSKTNAAYQKGLEDAWDAARKIIHMPEADLLNLFTECYSAVCTSVQVFLKYDASEAIEKIRQYEQIQIGDEVEMKCGVGPAIYMQGTKGSDEIYLLFNDGSCGVHSKSEIERKTGRHFPEIAEVLKKMQEEKE